MVGRPDGGKGAGTPEGLLLQIENIRLEIVLNQDMCFFLERSVKSEQVSAASVTDRMSASPKSLRENPNSQGVIPGGNYRSG